MTKKALFIGIILFFFVMATSLSETVRSDPDGELIINNGDLFTNSTMVTLTLDASVIFPDLSSVEMCIDHTENSTWTTWIPYNPTMDLNLPNVDGIKTVYVRFRLMRATSEIFQDSITLDTTPPSLYMTNPVDNGSQINSSELQVSWSTSDTGSGLNHVAIVDPNGNFIDVGANTTYTLTDLSNGSYAFGVEAVDNVGNTANTALTFTVRIVPPLTTPAEEGGSLWTIIGAIVVAIAIIVLISLVFKKKRNQEPLLVPKPAEDKSVLPLPTPKPAEDKSAPRQSQKRKSSSKKEDTSTQSNS